MVDDQGDRLDDLSWASTSMIRLLPVSAIIVRPSGSRWKAWISTVPL